MLETLRGVGYGEAFSEIKQRLPCGLVRHHATHGHTIPKNDSQRSFVAKIYTHTLKSVKYTSKTTARFYLRTTEITSTQLIK